MRQLVRFIYNVGNLKEGSIDSRGIRLDVGDKVLVFVFTDILRKTYLGVIEKDGLEAYSVYKAKANENKRESGYAFKVDFDVQNYEAFANKALREREIVRTNYLYDVHAVIMEALRLQIADQSESTALDYFGRELKPGSFVYYMGEKGLRSGIIVSSNQVLNEHLKIDKVGGVLSIDDLTVNERKEREELNRYLKKAMQKSKAAELGDILISGNSAYIYLGKFSFDCETDYGKFHGIARRGLWMRFSDDITDLDRNALLDVENIQGRFMFRAITKSIVYANSRESYGSKTDYDVTESWLLDDLGCFSSVKPKGLIIGTVELAKNLYISDTAVDRRDIGHRITCKFEFDVEESGEE